MHSFPEEAVVCFLIVIDITVLRKQMTPPSKREREARRLRRLHFRGWFLNVAAQWTLKNMQVFPCPNQRRAVSASRSNLVCWFRRSAHGADLMMFSFCLSKDAEQRKFKPSDIIQKGRMHWEKAPPPGQARSRPYQGVRVRDPVKELLRRKRSLEPAPPPQDAVPRDAASWYARGALAPGAAGDGGPQQGPGWRAPPWSPSEYGPVHAPPTPAGAYPPLPGHAADVYVQTLCPSYAMLTYTHAPLLANFGTVPVAPAPGSAPQMELPDSGLTYLPWAQPVTTTSATPSQVGPTGSPLVHVPLSMSLTTVIPQLEEVHHMDPDLEQHAGAEAPSLLDKLLEDQEGDGEEEDEDSYGHSLFLPPN